MKCLKKVELFPVSDYYDSFIPDQTEKGNRAIFVK